MRVHTRRQGDVLVATMDDGKANALGFEMISELKGAVAEAEAASCPLVLVGRDGVFSAGFDLAVVRGEDQTAIVELMAEGARLFRTLLGSPLPIVAGCTGHALAAGALLLLGADYRVGQAGDYKIGLNEVAIGLDLPQFAIEMAFDALDRRRLPLATSAAEVGTAQWAVETGFVHQVATNAADQAVTIGHQLAALPAEAFGLTKGRLRAPLLQRLDALGDDGSAAS